MSFYLYILYAEKSDKYYIGQSENYQERLLQHNTENKNTYTSKHRPWILKAVFLIGNSRKDALKIERFIKKQKNRRLIEKLIEPDFMPTDKLAQLVRVPHLREEERRRSVFKNLPDLKTPAYLLNPGFTKYFLYI